MDLRAKEILQQARATLEQLRRQREATDEPAEVEVLPPEPVILDYQPRDGLEVWREFQREQQAKRDAFDRELRRRQAEHVAEQARIWAEAQRDVVREELDFFAGELHEGIAQAMVEFVNRKIREAMRGQPAAAPKLDVEHLDAELDQATREQWPSDVQFSSPVMSYRRSD
jgi:hypothetical protein